MHGQNNQKEQKRSSEFVVAMAMDLYDLDPTCRALINLVFAFLVILLITKYQMSFVTKILNML